MVAFSYQEISWILYLAFILFSASEIGIYRSNVQVGNLYPRYRGLIVNLINGAFITNIFVETVAKSAYQNGISLKAIFLFFAFLGVLTFMRASSSFGLFLQSGVVTAYHLSSNHPIFNVRLLRTNFPHIFSFWSPSFPLS